MITNGNSVAYDNGATLLDANTLPGSSRDLSPKGLQAAKFSTRAVHAGCEPEIATGAVMAPIYMTSTFAQEYPGKDKGYDYTRAGNPNFTRLEQQLASLEKGAFCTVVASGLAAISAVLGDLVPGDAVCFTNSVYGGTYRLLKNCFEPKGISLIDILVRDVDANFETLLRNSPAVKWVILESPTNPLLEVLDIMKLCTIAKAYGVKTLIDNTFATPYHQQPLTLGATVSLHSTTKYIGGHSDVLGGAIITNDHAVHAAVQFQRKCAGFNPSPFDSWLLSRSLKTLGIRMERHSSNALRIAQFLQSQKNYVKEVYYPGLPSHPNYAIALKQMHNGFSGIISAEFKLSLEDMKKLISSFKLFTLAESLGGVESLVNHPASMTHASIPAEERRRIGLSDALVRFSVGIEDPEDLIDDLQQALLKVFNQKLA